MKTLTTHLNPIALLALSASVLTGCSTVPAGWHSPKANLDSMKTAYVIIRPDMDKNIGTNIVQALGKRGVAASAGAVEAKPKEVAFSVDYEDHWAWDLAMYLRSLDIQFHDNFSGDEIARGAFRQGGFHSFPNPREKVFQVVDSIYDRGNGKAAAKREAAASITYLPDPDMPSASSLPNFKGARINIINAQPATEPTLMGYGEAGKIMNANLHAWTDRAVASLKRALQKKGAVVAADARRTLKISVTQARLDFGGMAFHCTTKVTVETSDGKLSDFMAEDKSIRGDTDACDGIMSKIVFAVLTDARVLNFVTQP